MISSDMYYDRFEPPGVSYKGKLIGVESVHEPRGDLMCQEAMNKLKAMIKVSGEHKQRIIVNISTIGVRILDEKTMKEEYLHEVQKISFVSRDPTDTRAFGIVAGEEGSHKFFAVKTEKAAYNVVLALKELFETVLKSKQRQIEDYRGAKPAAKENTSSTPTPTTNGNDQQPTKTEEDEDPSALYAVPHKNIQKDIEEREASLAELAKTVEVMQEGLHNMEEFSIAPPPPSGGRRGSREPTSPTTQEVSMEQPIVMAGPPPTRAPPQPPSDPFQSQLMDTEAQQKSSASEDLFKEFGDTLTSPLQVQPPAQPSANPFGPPMGAPMGVQMGVPMNFNTGFPAPVAQPAFGMQPQPFATQGFMQQQRAQPLNQDPFSSPSSMGTDLFGPTMEPDRIAPPPSQAAGAPKQPDPFADLGLLGGAGNDSSKGGKDMFAGYKMAKPGEVGVPSLTPNNNSTSNSDHSNSSDTSGQEEINSDTGDPLSADNSSVDSVNSSTPKVDGELAAEKLEISNGVEAESSQGESEVVGNIVTVANDEGGNLVHHEDGECKRVDKDVSEAVTNEADIQGKSDEKSANLSGKSRDSVKTLANEAETLGDSNGLETLETVNDTAVQPQNVSQKETCEEIPRDSKADRDIAAKNMSNGVDLVPGDKIAHGAENGQTGLDVRLKSLDITSDIPPTVKVEAEIEAARSESLVEPDVAACQESIIDDEKVKNVGKGASDGSGKGKVGELTNLEQLTNGDAKPPSSSQSPLPENLKVQEEHDKDHDKTSSKIDAALDLEVESKFSPKSLSAEINHNSTFLEGSFPSPKEPPPLVPDRCDIIPSPDVPPPPLPIGFSKGLLGEDLPSPDAPPPPLPLGFSRKGEPASGEDVPSPDAPPPPLPKGFTPPVLPAKDTSPAPPPIPPRRKRPKSKGVSLPVSVPVDAHRKKSDSETSGSFRASWTNFEDDSNSAFDSNNKVSSATTSSFEDAFTVSNFAQHTTETSASISIGSSKASDSSLFSRDVFEQVPFDQVALSSSAPMSSTTHKSLSSSLHDPFSSTAGSQANDPFHPSDHNHGQSSQRDSTHNPVISSTSLPIHDDPFADDPFADDPFATASPSVQKIIVSAGSAEDRSSVKLIDSFGGNAGGSKQLKTSTGIPLILDDDPFAM